VTEKHERLFVTLNVFVGRAQQALGKWCKENNCKDFAVTVLPTEYELQIGLAE
jgi:hypothetical protein